MSRSRLAVPAAFAAAAFALVGCSSSTDGNGAAAPVSSASQASSSASSKPGHDLTVDISYGDDVAIGTLTVGTDVIEISEVADGSTYFKAGADFWRTNGAPEDAVATLADKYVVVTADTEDFSQFASLLDRQEFVDGVKPDDSDLTDVEITGPEDVNGVSCHAVKDSDGGGAYYAAAEGDPLPVQLTSEGDGELNFDGYGDAVDVPSPSPADVVQLPAS